VLAALLAIGAVLAGCAASTSPAPETPAPPSAPVHFEFHSAFLMNLHHFLVDAARHRGRLDGMRWTVAPSQEDMNALHDAVAFYAGTYGKKDLLFDDGMRDIRHALARADDAREDPHGLGLPPALAEALARVAPVYARCLWPAQDRTNRAWIARAEALEGRYGPAIQPRLERVFGARFPAAIRDDVVVNTGTFTGAYTDEPPPQTVLPSGWPEYDGLAALEMIWHEAAHTGPVDRLDEMITAEARATGRAEPEGLWHAALFYAVGDQVADVLKRDGGIDYTPYADRNGVYAHAWAAWLPLLRIDWQAWNDGQGTMEGAVRAMVAKLPPAPAAAARAGSSS
jgi:hypothetical protein